MPSVYIETSVVSHASARPRRDPIVEALRLQAREWWDKQRASFNLFTSQIVLDEAALGDASAAAERLRLLDGIVLVDVNDEVRHGAEELVNRSAMPKSAATDALHVTAASISRIDYLLTQNCRRIANAHMLPRVYNILKTLGVSQPLICTPAEFLQESSDDNQSNS